MPRLDDEEKDRYRDLLTEPRSPEAALNLIYEINEKMTSADFLNQAGLQFIRDAWAGAKFAQSLGATAVRLVPKSDEWPDVVVHYGDQQEKLECIEADLLGRQRGREYRDADEDANGFSLEPSNEEGGQAEDERRQIPGALWRAARQKAGKHYSSQVSLLINLNIDSLGWGTPAICERMARQFSNWTKPAAGKFSRVWILWEKRLYGPYHEVTPTSV